MLTNAEMAQLQKLRMITSPSSPSSEEVGGHRKEFEETLGELLARLLWEPVDTNQVEFTVLENLSEEELKSGNFKVEVQTIYDAYSQKPIEVLGKIQPSPEEDADMPQIVEAKDV